VAADELIFDEGVLAPEPLVEFQGDRGAGETGGLAILPWRGSWLEAQAAGIRVAAWAPGPSEEQFGQALVHVQKSRAATWRDLGAAWELLVSGGRLLVCGGNDLGITSVVKRLAQELDQPPRILSNRRHARIVAFQRGSGPAPHGADASRIEVPLAHGRSVSLHAEPGVFSAKRLDTGTQLLLEALEDEGAPDRILDLGCGIGPLGLASLVRWPEARALLLDGDARAVASAERNLANLSLETRAEVGWWDAEENCPETGFDLALVNPPFHGGKAVDLRPARAMFTRLAEALAMGGRALIVANRSLPYERDLDGAGSMKILSHSRGYKIIAFTRRSGSRNPGRGRGARASRR